MTNKRRAMAVPTRDSRQIKKQKTAGASSSSSTATARPLTPAKKSSTEAGKSAAAQSRGKQSENPEAAAAAAMAPPTPGPLVELAQKRQQQNNNKDQAEAEAAKKDGGNTGYDSTAKKEKKKETERGAKASTVPPPSRPPKTLPLEPHAGLLAELRKKYSVVVMSAISSSRIEKRVSACLQKLREGGPGLGIAAAGVASADQPKPEPPSLPGVVLLHARAADTGKLLSIVEIVKRRVREGALVPEGAEASPAAMSWYQYNRIYDVEEQREAGSKDKDKGEEADDGNDHFEPIPGHFLEAIGSKKAPNKTARMTYMSIFLSRVSIPELLRQPDVTAQSSHDADEMEWLKWMSRAGYAD